MIFPVGFKMFREIRDTLGQKSDLHFRRSGIGLM